ncbi:fatty acid desaturase [Aestuariibaculum sediminum]|uniref:fatty acid desaturase n=1 Tax=Aestuariibaculum sediminum TaxID=2770637 RepID=UPI001CB7196C|nr:fatty acid desaturase [Aestuariibaculum sediminum]
MKRKNKSLILKKPVDPMGVILAIALIIAWFLSLYFLLNYPINYKNGFTYLAIYIQTHLYTGLFITAHDAMHGSVSKSKKVNTLIGRITAILFAFNFYDLLYKKHHLHHRFVASENDPDFHESGNFWLWYWNFIKNYITLKQLVLMTVSLQVLNMFFSFENLLIFWVLPSILSTFQLFYFGTFIPHKNGHNHDNKHHSGTLKKNHLWAFLSCYFFGYHYEHHDAPGIPWWRLWQVK